MVVLIHSVDFYFKVVLEHSTVFVSSGATDSGLRTVF